MNSKCIFKFWLLLFLCQSTYSQSLHLNEIGSITQQYEINDIKKVTLNSNSPGFVYAAGIRVILHSGDTINTVFSKFKNYKYKIDNDDLSIDESNSIDFNLYPNPTLNKIEFIFSPNPSEKYYYELYNIMGEKIYEKEIGRINTPTYNDTASLEDYPTGIYLLVLKSGLTQKSVKIIKH